MRERVCDGGSAGAPLRELTAVPRGREWIALERKGEKKGMKGRERRKERGWNLGDESLRD